MPVLLVYAYNQKIERIGYEKVAKPQDNSISTSQTRRKRAISTGCGVLPLNVSRSEIPRDILGSGTSLSPIYLPLQYNAGICGGRCHGNLPNNTPFAHAAFIHLLLDRSNFRNRQSLTISQCCAPVRYDFLHILGGLTGHGLIVVSVPNMLITTCNCLEVAV